LTKDDIIALMLRNGYHPTDAEIDWLYIRFDRGLNGRINYQEFMDEILPAQSLLGEKQCLNILRKV